MPKISPLGQKLWPTGREQTDTQTDRQRKQTLRTRFFEFFFEFRFSFKGAVRKYANNEEGCFLINGLHIPGKETDDGCYEAI